jgi:hypothetical protein
MSIYLLKKSLECLKENQHLIADNERHAYVMQYNAFIEELEAAIEQAEKQEPAGFFRHEDVCGDEVGPPVPYYLTPPAQEFVCSTGLCHYKPAIVQRAEEAFESAKQRQWVGLTESDIKEIWLREETTYAALKMIEAKLKEKNAAQPAPVQEPPPECQTEAEKRAYAFGWWKAMEYVRQNGIIGETK